MKVTLGEKELTLTFGMMAAEEVASRQSRGSSGWIKLITDIVYGGYLNEVYLAEADQELHYRDIAGLVEEEFDGDKLTKVFEAFMSSKGGIKLLSNSIDISETAKGRPESKKPAETKAEGSAENQNDNL